MNRVFDVVWGSDSWREGRHRKIVAIVSIRTCWEENLEGRAGISMMIRSSLDLCT